MLPSRVCSSGTYIINSDSHDRPGTQWLAVYFNTKDRSAYYFDSYGLYPFVPSILNFVRRNSLTWRYNRRQLQCHQRHLRRVRLPVCPSHGSGIRAVQLRRTVQRASGRAYQTSLLQVYKVSCRDVNVSYHGTGGGLRVSHRLQK